MTGNYAYENHNNDVFECLEARGMFPPNFE